MTYIIASTYLIVVSLLYKLKLEIMKAIISELWNTGINIITAIEEDNEIQSFADLRKCENVIVGKKEKGIPFIEVLINDDIVAVSFRTVSHPTGCGKLTICEIF